jgi:hypothetical protein
VFEAGTGRLLTDRLGHVLFIADRGEISVSSDDGLSWIPFAGSIPDSCARITEATLDNSDRVWIGTLDGAVFRTSQSTVVLGNEDEEQPAKAPSPSVFPNPASSYFVVDAGTRFAGPKHVALFDIRGRLIFDRVDWTTTRRMRIDLNDSGLHAGLYFVRISETANNTVVPITLVPRR